MAPLSSILLPLLLGTMVHGKLNFMKRQGDTAGTTTTAVTAGTATTTPANINTDVNTNFNTATTPTTSTPNTSNTNTPNSSNTTQEAPKSDPNVSVGVDSCDALLPDIFCAPAKDQQLFVGESYYFIWNQNPSEWTGNWTIRIGLRYPNVSSVAYASPALPRQAGTQLVDIDKNWLIGGEDTIMSLYYTAFPSDPARSVDSAPYHISYNVTISPQPPTQTTTMPGKFDKKALAIALPIVLVFILLVILGLCIGMKGHRKIDVKGLMSKRGRGGYGTNKSKRQRLGNGIEKNDIRLQTRDAPDHSSYHDDNDSVNEFDNYQQSQSNGIPKNNQVLPPMHSRDLSFGSLVNDDLQKHNLR